MGDPYDKALAERIFTVQQADLSTLFSNIVVHQQQFTQLAEMYTYFRDTPSETKNFQTLQSMITDPVLNSFWEDVLQRKKNYKAFSGIAKFQIENNGRHPFKIMAGAYYAHRAYKRHPLCRGINVALINMDRKHYNLASENFQQEFIKFRPLDEAEIKSQQIINNQIEYLQTLGNLDDLENLPKVQITFEKIMQQIIKIRAAQDKDLVTGMKYGDFRCYSSAQDLDLQTLEVITDTQNSLVTPETITLIQHLQERVEKTELQHPIAGHLLSAHTHYWIGLAYQKAVSLVKAAMPPTMFFALPRSCSFEAEFPPIDDEMRLQIAHGYSQTRVIKHFEEAIINVKIAEDLAASNKHSAITHNATRGKPLSKTALLNFKGVRCKTIRHFRQQLTDTLNKLCPSILQSGYDKESGDIIEEQSSARSVRFSV